MCRITITIMILITTLYNTYINTIQIQADSVVSDTNSLLTSGLGPWPHEERYTILTMLTPQRTANLVMFKISIGRDPKNPTTSFIGQNPTLNSVAEEPTLASIVQSRLTLFKILRFSRPSLPGMTSSTLQPISCLGVYYDRWWLLYPLHASVKLHPMTIHLNS